MLPMFDFGTELVEHYPESRPTHDVVLAHYQANIESTGLQKWSGLVPLKLLSILDEWAQEECTEFYVPIGVQVRSGLKKVVGLPIRATEPLSDQHTAWEIHNHLAQLARTDVFTINSGFWVAGARS